MSTIITSILEIGETLESGNDVIATFSVAQTLMRNGIRGNGKEPEVRDPRGEGSLRIFMENGQLVKHCTGIAEVMGSNPVQA